MELTMNLLIEILYENKISLFILLNTITLVAYTNIPIYDFDRFELFLEIFKVDFLFFSMFYIINNCNSGLKMFYILSCIYFYFFNFFSIFNRDKDVSYCIGIIMINLILFMSTLFYDSFITNIIQLFKV